MASPSGIASHLSSINRLLALSILYLHHLFILVVALFCASMVYLLVLVWIYNWHLQAHLLLWTSKLLHRAVTVQGMTMEESIQAKASPQSDNTSPDQQNWEDCEQFVAQSPLGAREQKPPTDYLAMSLEKDDAECFSDPLVTAMRLNQSAAPAGIHLEQTLVVGTNQRPPSSKQQVKQRKGATDLHTDFIAQMRRSNKAIPFSK